MLINYMMLDNDGLMIRTFEEYYESKKKEYENKKMKNLRYPTREVVYIEYVRKYTKL